MPRDSQKQAVYNWEMALEKKLNLAHLMSLEDCQALVNKIWVKYRGNRLKPPKVKDGRRRKVPIYEPWSHYIKLPRWSRSKIVVLHETAHALLRYRNIAHGPVFARLVFDLWCSELNLDRSMVRRMASEQRPRRVRLALRAEVEQHFKSTR